MTCPSPQSGGDRGSVSGFRALRKRLALARGGERVVILTRFLQGRKEDEDAALRARLLLAGEQLRRLAAEPARAEFERVLAAAPPTARDLRARALYGVAQAAQLGGRRGRCLAALRALEKQFRDLRYARLASAARQRLESSVEVRVGHRAPAFGPVRDLTGRLHATATRRGQSTLILFVAPDDPPGVQRAARLSDAWRRGGQTADSVVWFALDPNLERIRAMVKQLQLASPVVACTDAYLSAAVLVFGVQALPDSYLIGPDGTLLSRSPRPRELAVAARSLR